MDNDKDDYKKKLIHFDIFIISSIFFLVGSIMWMMSMISIFKGNAKLEHFLMFGSSILYILGSIGFIIMPFYAKNYLDT
jgi:hypothetical protein